MSERLLTDDVCHDPRVAALSERAELVFHRLRLKACPLGRFYAEPALVKRLVLANRPRLRLSDVAAAIEELDRSGLASHYVDSDGARYLFLPSARQTKLKHAARSPFPAPCHGTPDVPGQIHLFRVDRPDPPPRPPEKPEGREEKRAAPADAGAAGGELFASLCLATGVDRTQLTPSQARKIALALAEIRRALPDLTAAEIAQRAYRYRQLYPRAACTAMALANHWAELSGVTITLSRPAPERPAEPENWREAAKAIAHRTTDPALRERRLEAAHESSWLSIGGEFRQQILREINTHAA